MTSNSGHYVSTAGGGEGIPAPSPHDQDVILEAWREVLGQVLHTRDAEWKQQLRLVKAQSMAAIAEMRANAAEVRSVMEGMIEKRLAQIREPADGPRGEPGPCGEPGPPGKIERLHRYVEDTVHYDGDVVVHLGSTYQARCDTAKAPPHRDWVCLASSGRDGVDGHSLRVRGTYRPGEVYAALDVVALNGGSFIARTDDPGVCPGDGWQAQSMPGKRGPQGEPGPQGERGAKGEPGPEIVSWEIDRDNYTVRAVLSDKTRSTPLDLRGLFEQYLLERINVERG
jgi:hypothetical protein